MLRLRELDDENEDLDLKVLFGGALRLGIWRMLCFEMENETEIIMESLAENMGMEMDRITFIEPSTD